MFIVNWFFRLVEMLSNQRGDNIDTTIPVDDTPAEEGNEDPKGEEGEEGNEGGDPDNAGAADEDDDGEGGREKHIPRERFDKVNAKAQRLEALVDAGVLIEDEDGNFYPNPKHGKSKKDEDGNGASNREDFRFDKNDVDDDSWPIAEKINKGFDHYEGLAQKMVFRLGQLGAQNAIMTDYPEFLQKDSALRKKSIDIMKNDPEFRKKYRGDPERSYWAVKRAAESLGGNPNPKPKLKKPKSKFITSKGDGGSSGEKRVPIGELSEKELDDLERKEHARMEGQRK